MRLVLKRNIAAVATLVDILPAGTGGTLKGDLDIVVVNDEVARNPQRHGVTGQLVGNWRPKIAVLY